MESLEAELRAYVTSHGLVFLDGSSTTTDPDFLVLLDGDPFWVEAKQKLQHIKLANWPETTIPEEDLFIVDELSARKLFMKAPNAAIIVRDDLLHRYVFIDALRLWLMPRVRVNRQVTDDGVLKGKWLINLRNGTVTHSLSTAMTALTDYHTNVNKVAEVSKCMGRFVGEDVPIGGELRTQQQRLHDYAVTR